MKIIKFIPSLNNKDVMLSPPIPAKKSIPDWYKDGETYYEKDGGSHPGLKTCKPFLDVMISGYFIVTPFDIHIGIDENNNPTINWDGPDDWKGFIAERPKELGSTIPVPAGHYKNHLVWACKWGWKTPKGWSSIITHPFNRQDLPFRTMSGLIDSDKFFVNGNIPFHLKEGFIGIIPAGTPFAQIIPIKRTAWRSIADYALIGISNVIGRNTRTKKGAYKNISWIRKEYE